MPDIITDLFPDDFGVDDGSLPSPRRLIVPVPLGLIELIVIKGIQILALIVIRSLMTKPRSLSWPVVPPSASSSPSTSIAEGLVWRLAEPQVSLLSRGSETIVPSISVSIPTIPILTGWVSLLLELLFVEVLVERSLGVSPFSIPAPQPIIGRVPRLWLVPR
mgnify:CR=1 FL=1